jgi:hypothetical protein
MCPVGAMRDLRLVADEPGDWAVHCHKCHHTMNAMGDGVRGYVCVDRMESRGAASKWSARRLGASASDVYDLRGSAAFVAVALWPKQQTGHGGLTSVNTPTPLCDYEGIAHA